VDSTASGTAPMIRIAIGAILMWIFVAMIGARMISANFHDVRTSC
jgi:hypothetical protein